MVNENKFLCGFSYFKSMTNFEAFCCSNISSSNFLFPKCDYYDYSKFRLIHFLFIKKRLILTTYRHNANSSFYI